MVATTPASVRQASQLAAAEVLRARRRGEPTPEIVERFLEPRPSVAERMAVGKELRRRVPRSDHAIYSPPRSRPDPVEILIGQAKSRTPKLVPLRYARMLTSPFAFLR